MDFKTYMLKEYEDEKRIRWMLNGTMAIMIISYVGYCEHHKLEKEFPSIGMYLEELGMVR